MQRATTPIVQLEKKHNRLDQNFKILVLGKKIQRQLVHALTSWEMVIVYVGSKQKGGMDYRGLIHVFDVY